MRVMLTIKDISKMSGYSITTISRALNNYPDISKQTKEKILKICEEHGYSPSSLVRNLSTKRKYTIGIVFQEETQLGLMHPFFAEVLNEFKKAFEDMGYDILMIGKRIGKYAQSYAKHIQQKPIDGIIILSSFPKEEEIKELIELKIPKVFMYNIVDGQACFVSDNEECISEVMDHLYNKGHRKIGFIAGDVQTNDGSGRFSSYKKFLNNHNLEFKEDYVKYGEKYTFEEGSNCARDFHSLNDDMPTAIVCSSDALAIGCLRTLIDLGVDVPNDIEITGYDNISLSSFVNPTLTTINQDKKELARRASRWLVNTIETKVNNPVQEVIPCEVIYRKSTK